MDDPRALEFEVSSDLIQKHYLDFFILVGNVVLVELVLFTLSRKVLSLNQLHGLLMGERISIYWGLVISNMIQVLLPWRFIIFGGIRSSFRSKANLSTYYSLISLAIFCLVTSLLKEHMKARKGKIKRRFRVVVRRWWVCY